MPTTKIDKVTPYRKGQKVVAATDLAGVPEGTAGKVKLINGMSWLRYWVQFDNGVWLGHVDHGDLVPAGEWEDFKRRRAEQAEAAAATPVAGAPAADGEGGAGASAPADAGGDSRVPAHLLERSKKARERLAAKG